MNQRPIGRFSSLVYLFSVLISIAITVIAILILKQNGEQTLSRASIISLITGELLSVLSLPLLFFKSKTTIWVMTTLGVISTALTLGAGLSFINSLISSHIPTTINTKLLTSLLSLIVSSQLFHGLSLSTYIHSIQDLKQNLITEQERHDIESLKEKVISLKASAATLVESRKASGNQASVVSHNNNEQQSSLFQSTKSRFSSKASLSSLSDAKKSSNNNRLSVAPFYSIKKLSMINQSSSSTNISVTQSHQPSIDTTTTPTDTSSKDAQNAKNLSLERDALKRIPSALLPPHLKPQSNQSRSFSPPNLLLRTSQSQTNLSHEALKENIPESIPRAATFSNIFTSSHSDHGNGIRTITPTDYERGFENFKFHHLRGPIEPSRRLLKSAHFGEFSPTDEEDEGRERFSLSDQEEEANNGSDISNKSTEEALKFVEDAHEKSSNEFIRDVIDQSKSTLQLERVTTPTNLTKSKSYSPHKSIFKNHHSRKDSSTSVSFKNFSVSMPSSPRKKSIYNSPKKLRIKNLSLSSIVFKDTEDEIPNLSYVHELQSSPSKKRRESVVTTTPTKDKQFDKVLAEKSGTPESNWSENSHKSVFPSEVIGEYDKEKWKTMERLHLVKQEDPHLRTADYPGHDTSTA